MANAREHFEANARGILLYDRLTLPIFECMTAQASIEFKGGYSPSVFREEDGSHQAILL